MKVKTDSGKVHYARPSRSVGYTILACTGRAMYLVMPVADEEVTCKACLKKGPA